MTRIVLACAFGMSTSMLVQRMQDGFSAYMPIPASGLTGAVTLHRK